MGSLAAFETLEVVGDAASLQEMAADQGFRRADVLLVDVDALNAANMDGGLHNRLREWLPGMKVVFLGGGADADAINPDDIPRYMDLGTVGFLLKDGPSERLAKGIEMVAAGVFACEMDVIRRILTRLMHWASETPGEQADHLSERRTEVLVLVTRGRTNKEIARELFVSEGTVRAHISQIMAKLGLDRRVDLVRYALGRGLAPLEEPGD